jgi:hypothetical protein
MTPELTDRERDLVAELLTLSYPDEWVEPTFRSFLAENPDEEEWDNIWEFATVHTHDSNGVLVGFLHREPSAFDLSICHDIEATARDLLDDNTLAGLLRRIKWTLIANTCLQLLVEWDVRPIRGVPDNWLDV